MGPLDPQGISKAD